MFHVINKEIKFLLTISFTELSPVCPTPLLAMIICCTQQGIPQNPCDQPFTLPGKDVQKLINH